MAETGNVTSVASEEERDGGVTTPENAAPTKGEKVSGYGQEEHEFDSGLRAWLQVMGAFFLWFNSWGVINTFGVFQTYYEREILSDVSPSSIAWIGSIQSFLLMFIGVITGPLFDAGYFYALVPFGSFMVVFGHMMTSLASEYYQIMLAQGICVGLGAGCLFVPSVALMPQYFQKKRALANGLAATGSSIGGVVYPIMFYNLQQTVGFAWAARSMAFVCLGTCSISISVMRVRFTPKQKRALFQPAAFKELPFSLFCLGMFMGFLGFYNFLIFIQPWAIRKNIADENLAFYLLPMLNAASTFGRVLPNFAADTTGPLNMLVPSTAITALLAFCWIAVDSIAGTIVLVVLYGFFSGGLVSLPPVVVASITDDFASYGTRLGTFFAVVSVALLVGTPIGGAIYSDTGTYLGVQGYCGACLATCSVIVLLLRLVRTKFKLVHKA